MDELKNLIEKSIDRLQFFEPKEGYFLAFSGGKDSIVCKELANMAGVKYDAHYSITTVDPPELTRYIKSYHPEVSREVPETNMWDLIVKKRMPPTRLVRYCCDKLKEGGGKGRTVITGVRWAESNARSKREAVEFDCYGSKAKKALAAKEIFLMSDNDDRRMMMEHCQIKGKHIVNPIIEWEDEHVWQFIRERNLPYPELYDQGFSRLGCIGCPQAGEKGQMREFERWPTYYMNYIKAFDRMLVARRERGLETQWPTGYHVMRWWLKMDKNDKKKFEFKQFHEKIYSAHRRKKNGNR